jgi:autotransporter translocation and assembly factor TamB
LWRKKISFVELTLFQANIQLSKSKDGLWNFERLSTGKGGGGGSFDWAIDLSGVEIRGGRLGLVDSSETKGDNSERSDSLSVEPMNFKNMQLGELNVALSGYIDAETKSVSLEHLSFVSMKDGFHLRNLSGSFYVDKKKVDVADFDLETDSSEIQLKCSMDNVDLLGGVTLPELRDKMIRVDLAARKFAFDDLKRFLPDLSFLNGSISAAAIIDGKFGDFAIRKLDVKTGSSDLRLAGTMKNLHKPSRLYMDVGFGESVLHPQDVNELLPKFNIPDLSGLGNVRITMLQYRGEPLNFTTRFDATTENCGRMSAEAHLDIRSQLLKYEATASGVHVDLAKITGNENLASSFNFVGTIHGSGTTLEDLNSAMKIEIDSSRIFGQFVNQSQITAEASNRTVNAYLALFSNPMQVYASCTLNDANPDLRKYSVGTSVIGLNLARLTGNSEYESDLTFKLNADGSGESLDVLNGNLDLMVLPSVFRGRELKQTNIRVFLDQQDARNKALTVNSNIVDALVQGNFDIMGVATLVRDIAEGVRKTTGSKTSVVDSSLTVRGGLARNEKGLWTANSEPLESGKSTPSRMQNLAYKFNFKDLAPLSVVLGTDYVDARGSVEGTVRGRRENLSLGGNIKLRELYFAAGSSNVLIQNGNLKFQLEHLSADSILANLRSRVDAEIKSFYFGSAVLSDVKIGFGYKDFLPTVSGRATIDTQLTVQISGVADISKRAYSIQLDTLVVDYKGYRWENDGRIAAVYDRPDVDVSKCSFKRGPEIISVLGRFSPRTENDLRLEVSQFRLNGLQSVFGKSDQGKSGLDGVLNLSANITGTNLEPILKLDFVADSIQYRAVALGRCIGKLWYVNKTSNVDLTWNIENFARDRSASLVLTGMLPVDLSLAGVENRLIESDMNVSLRTSDFPLSILDPFVQGVRNIDGTLNSDLRMSGTAGDPNYGGYVAVQDGQVRLEANNIQYLFSGRLEPNGDTIHIAALEVKNIPKDRSDGVVNVTGDIELNQFQLKNFDLVARGKLLALSESSKKSTKSVYGNLVVDFGEDGVRYRGNFESSRLAGTVLITEGNLIFPPAEYVEGYGTWPGSFAYGVIDDTSRVIYDSTQAGQVDLRSLYAKSVANSRNRRKLETSIFDGFYYDIVVETQRDIQADMIFNGLTGEELVATLSGKIFLRKTGGQNLLFGDVNISDPSVFKFWYRKLDATGKLRFNGDLNNPELNITAKYEGLHTDTTRGSTRNQRVLVTLTITGTKDQPKLTWSMSIEGEPRIGDVESDALSFLLTGKFERELTTGERQNMAVSFSDLGYSSVSSLLSGKLTDLLHNELGIIKSVEYQYMGGDILQGAQLSVSGNIGQTAIFRFGGRIFNDINSTNVNIEFPLGEIFRNRALRNLYLELERKSTLVKPEDERTTSSYGARLYYRIAF